LGDVQKIKEELDQKRIELEHAQRDGDLARAGELAYGVIPELEKKIAAIEEAAQENDASASPMLEEVVSPNHIAGVVSRWTGIPVDKMLEGEREKLLRMEDELRHRVIGQDEALTAVSKAVRRARAGLQDPNRPIGSFMFLGPTGVGKTELTKAVAAFLFDDDQAMVRIDMSEFMEKHSVARLIGAPPGYVGYEEGGVLTEAVRRRPYQVVLFDEIEKAHGDVFNVLLQVLDDGRLTDGQGRTVDFKNTLIIMTSNVGSEYLVNGAGNGEAGDAREYVMAELRLKFRPELLNRLDDVILFRKLERDQMAAIVDIQIARLRDLLADRKITLALTDAARDWLAEHGYDPAYGARPLKRVIQREIQDGLAEEILAGNISDGDTVRVDADGGELKLAAERGEAVAAA
ncbi:MAG: AAA family ATPase, partial [Pseudomonadota bacterium]